MFCLFKVEFFAGEPRRVFMDYAFAQNKSHIKMYWFKRWGCYPKRIKRLFGPVEDHRFSFMWVINQSGQLLEFNDVNIRDLNTLLSTS